MRTARVFNVRKWLRVGRRGHAVLQTHARVYATARRGWLGFLKVEAANSDGEAVFADLLWALRNQPMSLLPGTQGKRWVIALPFDPLQLGPTPEGAACEFTRA